MAKLPWSDEVEEERERCGGDSRRPCGGGAAMCTGEVTGDGEIEVDAAAAEG